MSGYLGVLAPGLLTTVQDLGRPGYQRLGIPPSGPLDQVGMRAANLLVGNAAQTAVLEIAHHGPTLLVEADSVRIALAGATGLIDSPARGDGAKERLLALTSARLIRGQRLCIASTLDAAAYLAVEGGFALSPVLGSLSTLTRAGFGGFCGRALLAGDRLPLCQAAVAEREELIYSPPAPSATRPAKIRIMLGPQDDHFTEAGLSAFLGATYTISEARDRMGMRLTGPRIEHSFKGSNIASDGIATGAIQVPGDGLPIVLLADRQTTGGYPKIATVISADLPALGRLAPGAEVAFAAVEVGAAEAAARRLSAEIALMPQRLSPKREPVLEGRLMGENLVSGMVDAREGG